MNYPRTRNASISNASLYQLLVYLILHLILLIYKTRCTNNFCFLIIALYMNYSLAWILRSLFNSIKQVNETG